MTWLFRIFVQCSSPSVLQAICTESEGQSVLLIATNTNKPRTSPDLCDSIRKLLRVVAAVAAHWRTIDFHRQRIAIMKLAH
ncbi:hypothetical protein HDK77DRAFT_436971 [Phyllosticta capitalensis]|uniref:uncharacterized protein n=1 Tax=Phyllosticta capitalensis TaxID=121624 RepID=UPI00312E7DDC